MKVEPIRDKSDIKRIEDKLFALDTPKGNRMFVMFEVGIYLGMRIGDMLKLRVGDIRGKEGYTFFPEKTDSRKKDGKEDPSYRPKKVYLTIPPELRNVVRNMYADEPDCAPLFPSRQTKDGEICPISRKTAFLDMKDIAKLAGLKYPIGCHTLRKTFGYHVYMKNHDIAWLQSWFQHSSPATTLIYIGIADDEKKAVTDHMPYGDRSRFDWASKRSRNFSQV